MTLLDTFIENARISRCRAAKRKPGRGRALAENAVKTQVWTAVSMYVLVAIVRKRLNIDLSLYAMLQILSVTAFEKIPLQQLLAVSAEGSSEPNSATQLNLLD